MAKSPQCPRIDWTREEKKLVFFSTTVQQFNQFKREHYSLKYFENLFQNMLNNECGIQAHNPYTKSFQYWHSVFERKLLSLRGLISINNRRHSVSILLINDCQQSFQIIAKVVWAQLFPSILCTLTNTKLWLIIRFLCSLESMLHVKC